MIEGEEEVGSDKLETFVRANTKTLANDVILISYIEGIKSQTRFSRDASPKNFIPLIVSRSTRGANLARSYTRLCNGFIFITYLCKT